MRLRLTDFLTQLFFDHRLLDSLNLRVTGFSIHSLLDIRLFDSSNLRVTGFSIQQLFKPQLLSIHRILKSPAFRLISSASYLPFVSSDRRVTCFTNHHPFESQVLLIAAGFLISERSHRKQGSGREQGRDAALRLAGKWAWISRD